MSENQVGYDKKYVSMLNHTARKRRKRNILLIVLAVVLCAIVIVAVWQWNNVNALIALRYSAEELEAQLNDNEVAMGATILEKLPYVTVKPPTEEEKELIRSGGLSEDEIVDIIMNRTGSDGETQGGATQGGNSQNQGALAATSAAAGRTTQPAADDTGAIADTAPDATDSDAAASDTTTTAPAVGAEPTTTAAALSAEEAARAEKQAQVERLIARVYALRETMVGQLEGIKNAAMADYRALPEAERTNDAKQALITRCYNQAAALEKSCDGRIETLLGELAPLLKETG
ncbi:MAG: hypothetical protein LBU58_09420, partial [Clostridiales bacterium]|nr:hypothetical protein [Clostridiales bacterium]